MKRLLLFALILTCGLLMGCGGGGNSGLHARGVARVTLHIALPDSISKSASRPASLSGHTPVSLSGHTVSRQGSRLIPSNATQYTVSYKDASLNTTTSALASITPPAIDPNNPFFDVTINGVAAGISNTITVTLYDSGTPSAVVASGSTTVNLAPGASPNTTNPINITLQSTVVGSLTYAIDGIPVTSGTPTLGAGTHTLKFFLANTNSVPVNTISGSKFTLNATGNVSVTSAVGSAPGGGYVFSFLVTGAGAATTNITYSEIVNNNGTPGLTQIKSVALSLNLQGLTQGNVPLQDFAGPPANNLTAAQAFDVADNGYALQFDPTANSRIAQYALPALTKTSQVATLPAAYTGTNSRLAYLSSTVPGTWAVVKNDQTQVQSFNAAGVSQWTHALAATNTILDVDAKGTSVYLLEQVGGVYGIEVLAQTTGLTTSAFTSLGLSFTPVNLTVTQIASPAETDYFLSDSAHVAVVRVTASQAPPVTFATLSGITDIATGTVAGQNEVFILSAVGITSQSAATGSLLTVQPLTAGATGKRLSSSGGSVYALESVAGAARIEGFTFP